MVNVGTNFVSRNDFIYVTEFLRAVINYYNINRNLDSMRIGVVPYTTLFDDRQVIYLDSYLDKASLGAAISRLQSTPTTRTDTTSVLRRVSTELFTRGGRTGAQVFIFKFAT